MKRMKLIVLLVLVMALSAIVLQNRQAVEVHFFWMTGKVPAIVLLFLTAAGGLSSGLLLSLLMKGRKRPAS